MHVLPLGNATITCNAPRHGELVHRMKSFLYFFSYILYSYCDISKLSVLVLTHNRWDIENLWSTVEKQGFSRVKILGKNSWIGKNSQTLTGLLGGYKEGREAEDDGRAGGRKERTPVAAHCEVLRGWFDRVQNCWNGSNLHITVFQYFFYYWEWI